jgi:WD40 repeat protein/serine/threonine protein kinase
MTTEASGREPLEKLAEEFAERHRRGERPSLSEYTGRYPELAEEIRELFPALVEMEQLASVEGPATGPFVPTASDDRAPPRQLGEYRILREVGHGGMGVVYEAVQESLGRHVALKVLPLHSLGNPTILERFKREARAAAKLHHSNIVPVFGVGEDSGIHYYAMQFIQGQGLDKVLDDVRRLRAGRGAVVPTEGGPGRALSACVAKGLLSGQFAGPEKDEAAADPKVPQFRADAKDVLSRTEVGENSGLSMQSEAQYYRSVARVGVQTAGALAYAHAQKVLHRDIKPSNLLLDRQGTVWVADFGLAKDEGTDLTRTGDVVGTLRYLPPERFQGCSDARGDVYSLGVTLYEMLTLRPAFEGSDRARLIEQIAHEQPPRPRKIDPHVPRDLETIVLKATDKEPGRRYPTAEALAEDLRRFLAGLPIQARPTPAWERLWKWAKRRPAEAAVLLVSGVAALLLVAGAVGLWSFGRLQEAYGKTQQAKEQVDAALKEKARLQSFHHIALAHAGWRDGHLFGVERLLQECPPEHRNWEWHYLQRHCHADLLTLEGHPDEVRRVAFSPDGTRLAAVGFDPIVRVWDTTTGQLLQSLKGHSDWVRGVAFSPDGKRLASSERGRDPTVKIWDLQGGQEIVTLKGHSGPVHDVAFSPDGKRLASGAFASGKVKIWDVLSGQELHTLEGQGAVAFSPDGKRLASGSEDKTVKVWDVQSGQELHTLEGHPAEPLWSVAFSPDGTFLLSGSIDGTVKVWDTATWQESRLPFQAPEGPTVCLSPDGTQFAIAGSHPTVKVWNMATGEVLHTLKGHLLAACGVAFSPDGTRLASASGDKTVKIWDATLDPEGSFLTGHGDHVRGVSFSPDGTQLASASSDGTVKVWDATTRQLFRTFLGQTQQFVSVTFSPDGRQLASASKDDTVRVWDLAMGQEALRLPAFVGRANSIAFSPDGRWLAFPDQQNRVAVWDVGTNQLARTFSDHEDAVNGVAFSPDGRWLASASSDNRVRLWDMTGRQEPRQLLGHTRPVWTVAFSPNGTRLASGSWDGTTILWDVTTGARLRTLSGHWSDVESVTFNQDGTRLATASGDGTVKIWDTTHGELVLTLTGHRSRVVSVAFSPDGTRLASASEDHTVRIWDGRPWTPEAAVEREALGRLEFLFHKPLCKADVIDYLRTSPLLRPQARQLALSLVDRYHEETDAERYHQASWAILRQRYFNGFQYDFALLQAKTACRLAHDQGKYATTLGAAQYRARQYQEALETLTKADQLNQGGPTGLAFLAMTQHQLGRTEEARKTLDRLREMLRGPTAATNREAADFLREAEETLSRIRAAG